MSGFDEIFDGLIVQGSRYAFVVCVKDVVKVEAGVESSLTY